MKYQEKTTIAEYFWGIVGMFLLALLMCLAITGITPSQFIADVMRYFN